MPRRAQPLVGLVQVDLALDRMDVGDGRIVEVAAPDERRQLVQESLRPGQVAGAGPGLDVGRPLPVLADRLVVFERRVHRHGDRGRPRVWPQAQIDAEDIAFAGALLQQLGQALGQLHRHRLGLDPLGDRQGVGLVEDRDVDVARIVELEGAVLAHGDDEQAGQGPRAGRPLDRGQPSALPRLEGGDRQGRRHRRIGEAGQGRGHLVQAPDPAEIGQGGEQVEVPLGAAQARAALRRIGPGRLCLRQQDLQPGLGGFGQDAP